MHFYKLCALDLDLEQGQGVMIDLETRLSAIKDPAANNRVFDPPATVINIHASMATCSLLAGINIS